MPNRNQEPEYGDDAEIIFLDPKDGIGDTMPRPVAEDLPELRRAQQNVEQRNEMRRRAEEYAMNFEIEIPLPDQEDDWEREPS